MKIEHPTPYRIQRQQERLASGLYHVGSDGRVIRNKRPRYRPYLKRCRFCGMGVIWVRRVAGGWLATEPQSWSGEEYFVSGKNVYHGVKCVKTREQFKKRHGIDPDLII